MSKDMRHPDFAESSKSAKKVIDSINKKKGVIPPELMLFLKGVPKPVLILVMFLVVESLVGIGFTFYYFWEAIFSLIGVVLVILLILNIPRILTHLRALRLEKMILNKNKTKTN